jgi:long-chain fatty acid transport protein
MSWMKDGWHSNVSLTYINLASIEYTDNNIAAYNGSSRTENFFLPQVHMVSPKYNDFRIGVSLTYPAGLSKRWEDVYPRITVEEFSLATYEMNPTVSYKVNDILSFAAGLRFIYADGTVNSYSAAASRNLEGDTTEFGYNLALTAKPAENLSVAVTYRSKVDLDIEGDATLVAGAYNYQGGASVSVPIPAVLTWAAAYNFHNTIIELVYDKTFWGAYSQLDFNYDSVVPIGAFENPIPKNWKNSDAFRIGLTRQATEKLKIMAGFAYDNNPIPDSTLGFELPDSDAKIYSIGGQYKYSDVMDIGFAYLYDDKESRSVSNAASAAPVNGTFTGSVAQIVTVAMEYRF